MSNLKDKAWKILIGIAVGFGLASTISAIIAISSRISDTSTTNQDWLTPLIFAMLFAIISGLLFGVAYLTK